MKKDEALRIEKKVDDLIGKRFNMLTVLELIGRDEKRNGIYRCRCDCGNETTVLRYRLTNKNPKQQTKSCGCLRYIPYAERMKNHLSKKPKSGKIK